MRWGGGVLCIKKIIINKKKASGRKIPYLQREENFFLNNAKYTQKEKPRSNNSSQAMNNMIAEKIEMQKLHAILQQPYQTRL